MKEYLRALKESLDNLEPDIAENQKRNKGEVGRLLSLNSDKILNGKLDKDTLELTNNLDMLLESRYHYFDEGYFCELKPEELNQEINDLIEIIEVGYENT